MQFFDFFSILKIDIYLERKLLIMGEELNVISLNESQKKEFMKRGKELCFRSFKVWCPEGYQILRFDPNLLIDEGEGTAIQTCHNYLSENLERIKRLSKKLSKDKKDKGDKETINAINDVINEIYVEYDNFKWNPWDNRYLNRKGFIKYGEKVDYRSKSSDRSTASDRLFRRLREDDEKRLSSIILNEESCGKIMDFLRLRMIKMKNRRPYIFEEYANYEMRLDDMDRKCLKGKYYDDPNKNVRERDEEKINEILKQRNEELNNFIEQVSDSEMRSVIRKHIQDISNTSELVNDNEELIQELRQYGQNTVVYVLIDKLHIINDELTKLIGEIVGGVSEFKYVKDQVEYDKRPILQSELALQSKEQKFLNDYKENSVENPDKLKNQSEAFWPIDSNGKEIGWKRYPIVMVKKEE